MTPERWRRVDAVLELALERSPEERAAILDEACSDPEMRRELDELLALEDEADRFLPEPLADLRRLAAPRERLRAGRRIGPYEIVELLERSGMSEVYLAARVDDFEKRVALKLFPYARGHAELARRFRMERQIQARLEHPYICRLLDGGMTEGGRPFFAMEYVEGEPIDAYCNRRGLGVGERLALVEQVCAAVHFAHQRLVVHRDLKPSNILVTAAGEPRLLDFGIAKLLRPERALERLETAPGTSPMTLAYASPEQVREEPISITTDVYSLGVLLYQLLTGRLPCGLGQVGVAEAVRRICDERPLPPSQAIGPGRDDAARLRRRLRGDVDAIVLKALRKSPERRYGSAAGLAADLRRERKGLPVRARRGTLLYHAGKLLRRHRWPLAAAAALLTAALALAVLEWRRLDAERRRAERVTVFLEELFYAAAPDERDGGALTAPQILARGREELETLADEPELYATLLGTLGRIQHRLGDPEGARELLTGALEAWRRDHPGDSPELARRLSNLGAAHFESGAYAAAEGAWREALAVRRRLGQDESETVKTLNNLAAALALRGAYAEAEELYRDGLEIRRRLNGPDSPAAAMSLRQLGWVLYLRGELDEAEPHLRRALELRRRHYGDRHTAVAGVAHLLGSVRLAAGDREESEALLAEALSIRRELLGDDHLAVARTRRQLAAVLLAGGESPATVAALLERALATLYRVKPAGDWEIADAESLLGAHLASLGRDAEAGVCLARSWETLEAARGREALSTRQARERLAAFDAGRERPASPAP